ncbi:MAG: carbon-nitrogen hydrolase [Pirellulaceae bacterium]
MVKISAIQFASQPAPAENVKRAGQLIAESVSRGAQVVCLQELFTCHYFCQSEDHQWFELAEPIPGPATEYLCQLAREHQVVIVAGLFESRAAGLFHNSAVVIDADGSLAGIYRKMHIPDDPFFYEKFYFTPGDLGFRSFDTAHGKIGVCICWDQWFPEAARLTAMSGAEILVYPTAIGWLDADRKDFGESQLNAWQTMIRSHAIANGTFVVAPNRSGREDNIQFWGSSFICDPYGRPLVEATRGGDEVIVADCDLTDIETARTHWPFLRDRRIDAYAGLGKRWLDD